MREFSYSIREGLSIGLPPDSRIEVGSQAFTECTDLLPSPMRLVGLPAISYPFGSNTHSSKTQLFEGWHGFLKYSTAGKASFSPINEVTYALDSDVLTAGQALSAATYSSMATYNDWLGFATHLQYKNTWFFGDLYNFLTNSELYDGWVVGTTANCACPAAVCTYMDRPVYAGLHGWDYQAGRTFGEIWNFWEKYKTGELVTGGSGDYPPCSQQDYIMFGVPYGGSYDKPLAIDMAILTGYNSSTMMPFIKDAIRKKAITFLRVQGAIVRVEPLGDRLIIYTTRGLYHAYPREDGGFSSFEFLDVPAISYQQRAAICNTGSTHYFIDRQGQLWKMHVNAGPNLLGYQDLISPLLDDTYLRLSYDAKNDLLHITGNSTGYTLHGDGMCKNSQLPRQIFNGYSDVYGVYGGSNATTFSLTSHPSDILRRAQKHIHSVELAYRDLSNIKVALDIKYNSESSAWVRTTALGLNKESVVFPRVTCTDFRLVITGSIDDVATATLDRITVRWRPTDSRYIRGLTDQHESFTRGREEQHYE